jgi:hypothetical protein
VERSVDSPGLRGILLAIVAIGAVGLLLELSLLDHRDSATQWIPYFVLAFILVATAIVWRRPSPSTLRLFQAAMLTGLVAGALGVILHYRGNVEFETERDSTLHGSRLVWEALHGATPALAPGALVQLALVGFAFAYRHPVTRDRNRTNGGDR